METAGGPDAKKARWSPTSTNGANGLAPSNLAAGRDAFANYGYGPQANMAQNGFTGSPQFNTAQLYSTPSMNHSPNGNMAQLSPNTTTVFQQQQQQMNGNGNGNGYGQFPGYNMLGMGLPGMNMLNAFSYNGQMANFGQVSLFLSNTFVVLIYQVPCPAEL